MSKSIAIIPARGGSKRIPRKNIKDFLGKPIIAYSIEAAIKSKLFDEVMVSTDDEEIAAIAQSYGAKVPFLRSEKNADDYATTMDVIKEVLSEYQKIGKHFEYCCSIYPTAPFVTSVRLIEGFNLMNANSVSAVLPIVEFSYNIRRAFTVKDNLTNYIWPEYKNARSQDLEKAYHDAGQWIWIKTNSLTEALFNDNVSSVILDQNEVQDIDTTSDWLLAEMKYKMMNDRRKLFIRVDANSTIGYGHLTRCLTIAEILDQEFDITFVCQSIPDSYLDILKNNGWDLAKIDDEREFIALLEGFPIVVFDGYNFSDNLYSKVKAANAKIISIQDIYSFTNNIDLVINHLPGQTGNYVNGNFALGPEFGIIRKEFQNRLSENKESDSPFFIALGGTENFELINKLTNILSEIDENREIAILTTPLNEKGIILNDKTKIYHSLGAKAIADLIDGAYCCFITSGMISYEALSRRSCTTIIGALNAEQGTLGMQFKEMGLVEYIGQWRDIDSDKLRQALEFKNIDCNKVSSVFDGKSHERIKKRVLEL